jgi:RNA polymerase sigma-70 factor (ECF subfamily)
MRVLTPELVEFARDNRSRLPRVLSSETKGAALLDEAAIREFLRTDYARMTAAVALVAGSRSAAEDAVQEAILRAWERSDRGEHIESMPHWVATVALNLSRSSIRRLFAERRARERLTRTATTNDPSADDRLDVERAIAALPRRQRETIVLRYLLDMNTREVAETLGVSEGTVKSSLARGRRTLATSLRVDDMEVLHDAQP